MLSLPAQASSRAEAVTGLDVPLLPPSSTVVRVLAQLPQVRAADADVAAARARSHRLQAGPYEWNVKTALQIRSDRNGGHFTEQAVGIETALLWPGKQALDQQLGELDVLAGRLAREEVWHEASRSLLSDWFETLREVRNADVLARQAQLASQQLDAVRQRAGVGGDSAPDVLAAQAEQARTSALAALARTRADAQARVLASRYPGLLTPPAVADAGPTVPGLVTLSAQEWVQRVLGGNPALRLADALTEQAWRRAERRALDHRGDPTVGVRAARERGGQERVIGVYASMPLGGAGRQSDFSLALAEADRVEQQLTQTRQAVEAGAWRTVTTALESRSAWERLEAARAFAQRSADVQASAYSRGETSLAMVLQARRGALEATLLAESARLEALQNQARLLLDTRQLWAFEPD